jgi:hypothetical protein
LTFASGVTAGLIGQNVTGTGIATGSTVIATSGTTGVTLSRASTAGVSSSVVITFAYDLQIDTASVTAGQLLTVTTFSRTGANA